MEKYKEMKFVISQAQQVRDYDCGALDSYIYIYLFIDSYIYLINNQSYQIESINSTAK